MADAGLVYNTCDMHGVRLLRVGGMAAQWGHRPQHGLLWLRDRLLGGRAIDRGLPWISYPCIKFFREALRPDHRVFEWGVGGSTVFFAGLGCQVSTVESSRHWGDVTMKRLRDEGTADRVDLRVREKEDAESDDDYAQRFAGEVKEGGPWDVVFVDGEESGRLGRVACVEERARSDLSPDAMIVLDDASREQYEAAVPKLLDGWSRTKFVGFGPARPGVTQTDVYRRPS